jgi:glycosyltransferase involved in cell wall biosynthesis
MSDCYLPRLGGIEVQVADLAVHLRTAGHHVEVVTATADGAWRTGPGADRAGTTVHRFALPLPHGVPVNPFAPPAVRELLRRGRFDVAHAHMGVVSPFATDLVGVALDLGLPTAVTWHCVLERSAPLMRAAGHARRWAGRGAALSAVSRMAADRVAAVAGAPVDVLGNGIDVAAWAPPTPPAPPVPPAAGAGPGAARDATTPVHVVSALRLARRKRPVAVLHVLRRTAELVDGRVPLAATVVGDGPQRPVLRRYARHHALDWVRLPGRVTRTELAALHQRADAYLSTARLEAFGIAALEGRTAGLPVVARRGTGVEDFVGDGVNGLLADDDEGLALALARLVVDAPLRRAIAEHNRRTPPAQAWPRVVEATVAEYHRAVTGRVRR